jgi:hypothetical protein
MRQRKTDHDQQSDSWKIKELRLLGAGGNREARSYAWHVKDD